jgi:Gp157 protein
MKMFDLAVAVRSIADRMQQAEEITPDLLAELEQIELPRDDKIDSYCFIKTELEADAELLKAQAAIFKRQADLLMMKSHTKDLEASRLWERLADALRVMGLLKHKTKNRSVWFQANKPRVLADREPESLPEKYRRTVYEPDREAMLNDWKSWKEECDKLRAAHKESGSTDELKLPTCPLPDGVRVEESISLRMR